ncbi:MAG: type 1 glutamine amidotransferase [Acidobacteriota bacterium]
MDASTTEHAGDSAPPAPSRRRGELHAILLQVRDTPVAEQQEQRCFLDRCEFRPEQLVCWNLIENPEITYRDLGTADVVFIGGAGAHSALDDHPFTAPLSRLMERLIADRRPTLGSCWGHQFLGRFLSGGRLAHDMERSEIGTFDIELTEAGEQDPLFAGLPRRFPVQLGHHDRIEVLAQDLEELAFSDLCPYQAVKVKGAPVYGTQFHSEMSVDDMFERLDVYREGYAADPETYDRIARALKPAPTADGLLGRFLDAYC